MVMVVAMLLGLCVSAFAADKDTVKEYGLYTCFGDSIPAIYHEEGYNIHGFEEIPGTYPSIIKNLCCTKMDDYAYAGFTTDQIRHMIDPSYEMSAYSIWTDPKVWNASTLCTKHDEVVESLKNSNLITINIGSNDVFSLPMIMAAYADYSMYDATGCETLDELLSGLRTAGTISAYLTEFIKCVEQRYVVFYQNMEFILSYINEVNTKDADIVLIGMYNPFDSMYISPELKIELGDIGYAIVDKMNVFFRDLAWKYDCIYVDVVGTETYYETLGLTLSDSDTLSMLADYVHPTKDGHQFIADRILAALPSRPDYKITLDGISAADTIYLDGTAYPAVVNNGVVSVNTSETDFHTATVYDKYGIKHVWKLSFEDGAYTAKNVSIIEAPITYACTAVKVITKATASTTNSILKKLLK